MLIRQTSPFFVNNGFAWRKFKSKPPNMKVTGENSMQKANNVRNYPVKKSQFKDWESVFKNSSPIKIETLNTGVILSKLSGILNLKNENASTLTDELAVIPVLAHLVYHEKFGHFLIDTGFDSSFSNEPGGSFRGILKKAFFKNRYLQESNADGIEKQLKKKSIHLAGVFFTHMHEHASGSASLPDEISFVYGDGESEVNLFPLVYSRFLNNKTNLQKFDFSQGQPMPLLGDCIDIFGDGSFWAISTPGHTKGHTSFIVNGEETQALVTGDVCISKRGFDLGVETGTYTANLEEGRRSFLKIQEFAKRYPNLTLLFGHETDQFKIAYNTNSKQT
jgi:N-acyl homoserine lactone hydrolase